MFNAIVFLTHHWFISGIVVGVIVGSIVSREHGIIAGIITMVVLLIIGSMLPSEYQDKSKNNYEVSTYTVKKVKNKEKERADDKNEYEKPSEKNENLPKESEKLKEEKNEVSDNIEDKDELSDHSKEILAKMSKQEVDKNFDELLGFSNAPGKHWIQARNNGAYIWNPLPTEGESVEWSGNYIQEGNYRYADGVGTITWYSKEGRVVQIDDGTLKHGQRDGKFKHQFLRSGKIEYSNWKNGKIPVPENTIEKDDIFVGNSPATGYDCYIIRSTLHKMSQNDSIYFLTLKMITPKGEIKYLNYEFNLNGNFKSDHLRSTASEDTPIELNIWKVLNNLN